MATYKLKPLDDLSEPPLAFDSQLPEVWALVIPCLSVGIKEQSSFRIKWISRSCQGSVSPMWNLSRKDLIAGKILTRLDF